jgi:hypothetical protein
LQRWRYAGIGPEFTLLGERCVRYDRECLAAFVAGHTRPAGEIKRVVKSTPAAQPKKKAARR